MSSNPFVFSLNVTYKHFSVFLMNFNVQLNNTKILPLSPAVMGSNSQRLTHWSIIKHASNRQCLIVIYLTYHCLSFLFAPSCHNLCMFLQYSHRFPSRHKTVPAGRASRTMPVQVSTSCYIFSIMYAVFVQYSVFNAVFNIQYHIFSIQCYETKRCFRRRFCTVRLYWIGDNLG